MPVSLFQKERMPVPLFYLERIPENRVLRHAFQRENFGNRFNEREDAERENYEREDPGHKERTPVIKRGLRAILSFQSRLLFHAQPSKGPVLTAAHGGTTA